MALFKSVDLFYEKNMSDSWVKVNRKLTGFEDTTVFGNNRNNTAQVVIEEVHVVVAMAVMVQTTMYISSKL